MPTHSGSASEPATAGKPRPLVRKGFLAACAVVVLALPVALTLAALIVEDANKVPLTRVRTGLYLTSDPDEPTRVFVLRGCTVPADGTRVTTRKLSTFAGGEYTHVVFPNGEWCFGYSVFGTRPEDLGVVRVTSVRGRAARNA